MDSTTLKAAIDIDITDKTVDLSIDNVDVGERMKDIVDYVDQEKPGYLVYTALISQSGTSAPTAKVLKNTLGTTISFAFTSTGNFAMTGAANVFTNNKTAVDYSFNSGGSYPAGDVKVYSLGAQFFIIETRNSGTLANGIITDTFVEIRVYP